MNRPPLSLERSLGWLALLILFGASIPVLLPFGSALLWALILCSACWPLYERLLRRLGGRRTLASLILSLGLALVVLTPFLVVGSRLAENIDGVRATVQRWMADGLPPPPAWVRDVPVVGRKAAERWQVLGSDKVLLKKEAERFVEPVTRGAFRAGAALGKGLAMLALSAFMVFFLLRGGAPIVEQVQRAAGRIGGERGQHLLRVAATTVRGVVYGILGTALLQAVLAGIGFMIAGVPAAGLLTLLTFFLAILPAGPPLVWLPAALWLFAQGSSGWGGFMLVWGAGVSSVDNFVKPWLISQGSEMPFLLTFIGVLGGALAYGFIGVFLGPTLLAVAWRLVAEWAAAGESARAAETSTPGSPGSPGNTASVSPSTEG